MTPEEKAKLKAKACKESQSIPGIGGVYEDMISMYDLYQIIDDMPESEISLDQAWEKIAEDYPTYEDRELKSYFKATMCAVNKDFTLLINNGIVTKDPEFLDKPLPISKKIKVPQWFYDWVTIEFGNMKRHAKVAEMYRQLYCGGFENYQYDWIEHNTQTAINAILYGCEPIEPLYIMPVPYTEEEYYFEISLIGVPKPAKKWEAQKFTLAEINKYFPKIAEFKEEVTD